MRGLDEPIGEATLYKRIAELEQLTASQASTIMDLERDCDGRNKIAKEEVKRLKAELAEANYLIEAQKREILVLQKMRDDAAMEGE